MHQKKNQNQMLLVRRHQTAAKLSLFNVNMDFKRCVITIVILFFCSSGGWWSVSNFGEITGSVAIEMQNNSYIHALDTGLFTVGAPHKGEEFEGIRCLM